MKTRRHWTAWAFVGLLVLLIDGLQAFLAYVGPAQINVLAPADGNLGTVPVVVTNAAGTSAAVNVASQTVLPAFFATAGYATGPPASSKPGDIVSLYGTGFGPTTPAVAPGVVSFTPAVLANQIAITLGGLQAAVSFAGLSAAGLYQFNVTVPELEDGDHAVSAQIAGASTPSGVLLKTQA